MRTHRMGDVLIGIDKSNALTIFFLIMLLNLFQMTFLGCGNSNIKKPQAQFQADKNRTGDKKTEKRVSDRSQAELDNIPQVSEKMADDRSTQVGSQLMKEERKADRSETAKVLGHKKYIDDISIASPVILPRDVKQGGKVEQRFQYTIMSAVEGKVSLTERVIFTNGRDTFVLVDRVVTQEQGTYMSTLKFFLPNDIEPGSCALSTAVGFGKIKKSVTATFNVVP